MNGFMLGLVGVVLALSGNVQASIVNLTGGFTSFSSSLTPPNSPPTATFVNGYEVIVPADGSVFTVPLQAGGVSSVDFWQTDFSGQDTYPHNLAAFLPGPPADVVVGQEFLLGTFTFGNGVWFGEADISLSLTTQSMDPSFDNFIFTDVLHFHLNPYVAGDPLAGADEFSFVGSAGLGGVKVYELFDSPTGLNSGTVQLLGKIGSLYPTRFVNPQGGLSLVPGPGNNVPEPGTISLSVGAGLIAFVLLRRSRRTAPKKLRL